MLLSFHEVLNEASLTPLYQPIVDLKNGDVMGFEGLIRGPCGSPLHGAAALFEQARLFGEATELERLCRKVHIDQFLRLGLHGKLFLNMSRDVLLQPCTQAATATSAPYVAGMAPGSIVVEVTESDPSTDYPGLRQAAAAFRGQGSQIAIDDLGEGFSSLRLWSELRPEYVKIDRYFIQGIDQDKVKRQFLRSMLEMAQQSNSQVIAEGIETADELRAVRELGVPYGQGFFLGRPSSQPPGRLPLEILCEFGPSTTVKRSQMNEAYKSVATARKILRPVPAVADTTHTNEVHEIFQERPDLQVLAVLRENKPIGLIHRLRMLDRLARPYHRELYGTKPCALFIENMPLIIDQKTSLQDLSHLITESSPEHLTEGFILCDEGRYVGVGTGLDLIREITQMQIHAARYANPLTQLPGNVPINEQLDDLLAGNEPFWVCYGDLDHFKPFNDLYSYQKGDEIIQITANLLREYTDPAADFVGHIGGDDFIVVFKSADWRARCERIVKRFSAATLHLYKPSHRQAGGYTTENRQGESVFHPLVSLSLGVVPVDGALPYSSYQVAELAAQAKTEAKKIPGNSLFIERRSLAL